MKLVSQFLAERKAQKLKSALSLSAVELTKVKLELVEMGPSVIRPLMECLSHGEARPAALEVLERMLDPSTLDLYLDALASPNPAIVSGIARVMGSSDRYDPARLLPSLGEKRVSRPVLESILNEKSSQLPAEMLLAGLAEAGRDEQVILFRLLEKSANQSHASNLIPLLQNPDPWVRMCAVRLVARYPGGAAERAISNLLVDENKGVRLESVLALQAMGSRGAVPELIALLRDADLKVQTATIDALSALGDSSAVPLLLEVLTDEAETARRAAVEVLNAVATTEAIQDLVRALRDEDWWVRVRAADALGTLGGEKVVQAVLGLLRDEDDFIRRHAVEILNAVPNQGAVEALIEALDDPDWWVRERAIDALGKTRDPRALEPLVNLMSRGSSVLPLCARALGALKQPGAIDPLINLLQSDREDVCEEARQALLAINTQELDPRSRDRVREALGEIRPGSSGSHSPMRIRARGGEQGPEAHRLSSPLPSAGARPPRVVPAARPSSPAESAAPAPSQLSQLNFADLASGTLLLDRYRVVKKIGRGGFGAVYLAADSVVHEDIILKILNPQLSMDQVVTRRFVQELKLTRKITHKNIIRIYDFLDLKGAHAVSMEYFPGSDLGHLLDDSGRIEPRRGLHILAQVCEGLSAAHAEGVVHRDIKPPNILVGEGDEARVVDFGLASVQQQIGSRLTKSGLLIGTPEYMAPEQISDENVDHRSDLYSLGVVMYEMFSGTKPFLADTPVKVLFQHLEGHAEPLGKRVPGLPPGVEELVADSMARDPDARPATALELLERIRSCQASLPEAA